MAHVWERVENMVFLPETASRGNLHLSILCALSLLPSLSAFAPFPLVGALPPSQMGRTDAAAEVKTDFEPMGRGGRCGEEGGNV